MAVVKAAAEIPAAYDASKRMGGSTESLIARHHRLAAATDTLAAALAALPPELRARLEETDHDQPQS
jgi:hypothetical protein